MKHTPLLSSLLALSFVCLNGVAPLLRVRAQTNERKAQPFGSSLKRPKAATGVADKTDGREAAEGEASDEVITVDTSLVLLDVLVTDATGKKPVAGLTRDDFVVAEDGRAHEVSFFALGDDAARLPRSIVLVFDRSGSQLAYLEASVEAAKKLVNRLAPTDEMAIVTDDVELAVGFTRDKKRLKQTLDSLRKWTLEGYHTRSMQFSALLATLRELVGAETRRPIIIFQTDGDEVSRLAGSPGGGWEQAAPSEYGMEDVYAEAERSRAKIYTVVPNDRLIGYTEEEAVVRARLMLEKQRAAREKIGDMWYGLRRLPPKPGGSGPQQFSVPATAGMEELREKMARRAAETFVQGQIAADRVAELTGGWTSFLEKPEQADEIYGRILADINSRYVLGYYPANKEADGTLRRVRVEVRGRPEYQVQGRRSYRAARR
jgi:VWFA-related protein